MADIKTFSLMEHRFRSVAWVASTSARASRLCSFKVEVGNEILRDTTYGICKNWETFQNKVKKAGGFDKWHQNTCLQIMKKSEQYKGKIKYHKKYWVKKDSEEKIVALPHCFSYGVAAKLLNCYLKELFVTPFEENLSVENRSLRNEIHPPIDRILLQNLGNSDLGDSKFWRKYANIAWSKFSEEEYLKVIQEIKNVCGARGLPLWKIEYHWSGYQ